MEERLQATYGTPGAGREQLKQRQKAKAKTQRKGQRKTKQKIVASREDFGQS